MSNHFRVQDIELGLVGSRSRSNHSPKRLRGDRRRAIKRSKNGNSRSGFTSTEEALKEDVYQLQSNMINTILSKEVPPVNAITSTPD